MILIRLSNTSPAYSIATNHCVYFDDCFSYSKNFLLVENLWCWEHVINFSDAFQR
jgi:hypothetical protein